MWNMEDMKNLLQYRPKWKKNTQIWKIAASPRLNQFSQLGDHWCGDNCAKGKYDKWWIVIRDNYCQQEQLAKGINTFKTNGKKRKQANKARTTWTETIWTKTNWKNDNFPLRQTYLVLSVRSFIQPTLHSTTWFIRFNSIQIIFVLFVHICILYSVCIFRCVICHYCPMSCFFVIVHFVLDRFVIVHFSSVRFVGAPHY